MDDLGNLDRPDNLVTCTRCRIVHRGALSFSQINILGKVQSSSTKHPQNFLGAPLSLFPVSSTKTVRVFFPPP